MWGVPRVHMLRPADLALLPVCPDCGFAANPDEPWARSAQQQWGMVGVEFVTPTGAIGYALVALPDTLPEDHPLSGLKRASGTKDSSESRTDDAIAIVLAAHVEGETDLRHRGLSRLVITSLAGRLAGRVQAIEAAGSRVHSTCQAPSAAWLSALGFEPTPGMEWLPGGARRMRLDLRRTVTWQVPWARVGRRLRAPSWSAGWRPAG